MIDERFLFRLDVLQEGMLLSKDNAPLSTSENNQNSENKLLSEILDAAQSLLKSIHQRHHIQTVNASRATAPVINASAIVIGRGLETLEKLSKEWIQTHSSWATTHSFLETLISLVESVSPREEAIEPKSFVRSMDAFLNAWIETKEELTKRYCGDSKYTKDSYPQLANSADTIISDGDFLAATVANDHFRSTLTSSKTRISLPPQYQSMALQMSQLVSGQRYAYIDTFVGLSDKAN